MKVICGVAAILAWASTAAALTPKEVYKKSSQAVVLILGSDDGKQGSGGTGSVITSDGKIITNAHVVISHSSNQPYKILYVFLKPERLTGDNGQDLARRYKARVTHFSPADELDLALLQLDEVVPGVSPIAFADPNKVDVGDEVVAIGHPEQGGLWTLTTGSISTVIANYGRIKGKDVFQTEASVNRGNSGGPLLDSEGNMVGINTMIARQAADGVAITSVNFSLKSSVAVGWLSRQGMGLAYAPKLAEQTVAVAAAPAQPPPTTAESSAKTPAPRPSAPAAVAAPPTPPAPPPTPPAAVQAPPPQQPAAPPATIVLAEPPPAKAPAKIVGEEVRKGKTAEPVVKGNKAFDPAKAQPKYGTEKRPFNLDDLRRQQMKELEDMMNDMRGKAGKGGKKGGSRGADGMGLW